MPEQSRGPGRVWVWFLVIAGVGLLVRVLYLVQARAADPLFLAPRMDALYHHRWALAIAAGAEFIPDAFFRAPLYPWFLAALYKLTGADLFWARLGQAVLGSASCGLVYLLGRRLFGQKKSGFGLSLRSADRAALTSGLVMALYPLAIYFDGELLIPNLLVFLVLFGFVLLYWCRDRDKRFSWHWLLPGLVFGMVAITRPNVLAFLAVLVAWFLLEYRAQAWKRLALFFGAVAIVIAPVTIRNYAKSGQFVLVAWQAGTNFYIGNNPHSDGMTAILPGTRETWWGGFNDVKRLAESALGRPLKGAEIDRYWMNQGLRFWREQPLKALGLAVRKFYLLITGYEISNNRDIYFFKRYSFLGLLIHNLGFLRFPFGLVLPLALVGFWLSRRQWRRLVPTYLFLGAYGLSFVLFFVTARFRMPMVPLFIVMAVYGLVRLKRLRGRELGLSLAVLVPAYLLVNSSLVREARPGDMCQSHMAAALGWYDSGKPDKALVELEHALAYDSAENVLGLEATILTEAGEFARAEQAALAAVRLVPEDPDGYGTLGSLYAKWGRFDTAQACLEKCVELDPYSVAGWNNLGNISLSHKDLTRARECYERALSIDPVFTNALYLLGLVDYYEGNRELAHSRWQKVLELEPGYDRARQALEQLR